MAELGIVGLLLLVLAIGLILGAFAYRARGPDRSLFAALLAAGLVWAIHAGVDWDWQMPAVTIWFFALGGLALSRSRTWRRHRPRNQMRTTALRAAAAIACVFLTLIPARMAVSQARLSSAIEALNVENDCRKAQSEANSSLSAVSQRPTPYVVIAYCDILRDRYGSATIAMHRAVERDPRNWELYYDLAVARAGAGLDPRPAADRAAALNPEEDIASSAPQRFRGNQQQTWETAAEKAPFLPSRLGDP